MATIALPSHLTLYLFSFIHENFYRLIFNWTEYELSAVFCNQRSRVLSIHILIASRLYKIFSSIILKEKYRNLLCGFMAYYGDIEGLRWAAANNCTLEVNFITQVIAFFSQIVQTGSRYIRSQRRSYFSSKMAEN